MTRIFRTPITKNKERTKVVFLNGLSVERLGDWEIVVSKVPPIRKLLEK